MKNSFLSKLIFFFNVVFAILLLLSYLLPYISPKSFPSVAILSLLLPLLLIINIVFVVYWLIKLKLKFFLSASVLTLGLLVSPSIYKFSSTNNAKTDDLKVMSYNVRTFNYYKWNKDNGIADKILAFINEKKPDILCLQEYHELQDLENLYPYKYLKKNRSKGLFGMAIFSKYKLINYGSFNFENTINNAIFADFLFKNDTVRVYNLHLESLKIKPDEAVFGKESKEKLFKRVGNSFKKQTYQVEEILAHQESFGGKLITCGDFNNTANSWVYHKLSKNKKDAFLEAGKGFGKSFDYLFPMRIDFILTDKSMLINQFKTYAVEYSDHFPIMARLNY